ncbi:MAG: gamma-glutamyl-gamma-aminobutyrate hydrolase family protein [Acidimicrobiaceae bacterium]|nr:gamma-glutamyl-gamma-aminobutyrate hydrolase family protein [Acidimicrobiaceae bacterium]
MNPLVLIVGRLATEAKGVRGEPFAAGRRYFEAVAVAGGMPLMLPPITSLVHDVPDLLRQVDAVVLHGGGDVDPRHYGQQATAEQLYGIVPEHDEVELAVVRAALDLSVPMLAICRGMQVLNVAMGGTLQQDIGTEAHWFAYHEVALEVGSRMAKAVGSELITAGHCVHHQALDRVADGLRVVGRSDDGVVHACELDTDAWVLATQWHPEDSAATDPQQQALFTALIDQI